MVGRRRDSLVCSSIVSFICSVYPKAEKKSGRSTILNAVEVLSIDDVDFKMPIAGQLKSLNASSSASYVTETPDNTCDNDSMVESIGNGKRKRKRKRKRQGKVANDGTDELMVSPVQSNGTSSNTQEVKRASGKEFDGSKTVSSKSRQNIHVR